MLPSVKMISPSGDNKLDKLYCIHPVYGEKAPVGMIDDTVDEVDVTRRPHIKRTVGTTRDRRDLNHQ